MAAAAAAATKRFDSAHKIETWILWKFYENYAHYKWTAIAVWRSLVLSPAECFHIYSSEPEMKINIYNYCNEKHNMLQLDSQTNRRHNYRPEFTRFSTRIIKLLFSQSCGLCCDAYFSDSSWQGWSAVKEMN